MKTMRSSFFLVVASQVLRSLAQFPPQPTGVSSIQSKLQPGVKLTYKPTHICETTPGVKSYSGYVHLPASVLEDVGDYNISTFFWFFEARHGPETAPLAIWLNGGPGESGTYTVASSENGPCYANIDGNSTTLSQWSFNNHVNMLYIDQPVQSGFSYNTLINGTYNISTEAVTPADFSAGIPAEDATLASFGPGLSGPGVFSGQSQSKTTNNTVTSAKALWHFAENWFTQFPEYTPKNKKISFWGNSYGGYWVPGVAAYFDRQIKQLQKSGSHPVLSGLDVDTIGITNGCIDLLISVPEYPKYTRNNTYGLKLYSEAMYESAMHNFTKPGGCRDLIVQCRTLAAIGDPQSIGNNFTVNEVCQLAAADCYANVIGDLSTAANRSNFDVAVELPDYCPLYTPVLSYFNQPWVLEALGVPLNFTYASNVILDAFGFGSTPGTGDGLRRDISDLEYLLNNDVKVAMAFGDRDYRCNWMGGEATALAAKHQDASHFKASGYEKIFTNSTYSGGVVKQYRKFSFSRIYQAGHSVQAYQPETIYRIFMRSMFNQDIATGTKSMVGYSSKGPASSLAIRDVLPSPPTTCVINGEYQNETLPLFAALYGQPTA